MELDHDPVTARAQGRVGATLRDKWRLDSLLGVGGMAAVYAATHRNGARGAIKILHAELAVDAGVRQRFLREGYAANTVAHRGVVKVLDDDVLEDGSVFLVMELLEGESLESRRDARNRRFIVSRRPAVPQREGAGGVPARVDAARRGNGTPSEAGNRRHRRTA
ncbi:MAG TPA: hypothetical protein PLI95_22110 [Polyangiaceae bacterium]|nr:hypothetical protein [Polyangiaceae bacterium]